MWPLFFYLPWVSTVVNPVLGLAATTAIMMYHYTYKQQIIQRIELSILPNPAVNIFQDHIVKRTDDAPQKTNDSQAESSGKKEPSQSPPKMEIDEPSGTSKGNARTGETPEKEVKKSPYVWGYATW